MLIATIHDVAPPFLDEVEHLRRALRRWGVGAATLLAVPDYHGHAPLASCVRTVSWLRRCAARGDEIALHGVTHRQDAPAPGRLDRLRAAALTAGEGEMLGAGAADPARLAWARAQLEELVEVRVAGFVAPAWLEPAGLAAVLAQLGFAWHETSMIVESLADGTAAVPAVSHRIPVIGFATRSWWRERAALGWAAALAPAVDRWAARTGAPIRLALHPGDLGSPRVMRAAERVVRAVLARHPAVTTAAALAAARGP